MAINSNANLIAYATFLPGAAVGASSTAQAQYVNANPAGAANAVLTIPGSAKLRVLKIRAGGKLTNVAGGATTLTLKLYQGATTGGTQIATSGAITVTTTTSSWYLDAELTIDTAGQKMNGRFSGAVANTVVAIAALSGAGSSLDPTGALQFCASAQFSVSDAGNATTLEYFYAEEA